jgi:uncharacterized protein (DUF1778 family)
MPESKTARLDLRLTSDQKNFFQSAFEQSGFNSFSEFVIQAIQKQSEEVILKKELILKSGRDKEVFFNALISPEKPNDYLKEASKAYRDFLEKSK